MISQMVSLDNADRAKVGVKSLTCDEAVLGRIAYDWSKEMCRLGTLTHGNFTAKVVIARAAGYRAFAENIAYNKPPRLDTTVSTTHAGWMNSTGHRKNILSTKYTHVGYGWHVCSTDNRIYWTGFFGGPYVTS
jgi:uncharacterized protein YkwD